MSIQASEGPVHPIGSWMNDSEETLIFGKPFSREFSVLLKECQDLDLSSEEIDLIKQKVQRGSRLAQQILDTGKNLPESDLESVLDLTWFLMGRAYQENGEIFYRGTVRLHPLTEEQTRRFKYFYKHHEEAHNRPSSHFRKETIGHHKGVDFAKGVFPFDKDLSTILCGRLKDGSFFLKIETEALSFFKKPVSSVKHCWNWFLHSIRGGGRQQVRGRDTKRETDARNKLQKPFRQVIRTASALDPSLTEEVKNTTKVYKMHRSVTELSLHMESRRESVSSGFVPPSVVSASNESLDLEDDAFLESTVDEPPEPLIGNPQMYFAPITEDQDQDEDYQDFQKAVENFHTRVSDLGIPNPEQAYGREVVLDLLLYIPKKLEKNPFGSK